MISNRTIVRKVFIKGRFFSNEPIRVDSKEGKVPVRRERLITMERIWGRFHWLFS